MNDTPVPDDAEGSVNATGEQSGARNKPPGDLAEPETHIGALAPFGERVRHSVVSDSSLFDCVVRAAFAKCFDYISFAHSPALTPEAALYSTGPLRSICEDLIVVPYMALSRPPDWRAGIDSDQTADMKSRSGLPPSLFGQNHYPGCLVVSCLQLRRAERRRSSPARRTLYMDESAMQCGGSRHFGVEESSRTTFMATVRSSCLGM
jgi:hypothetical protein